MILTLISRFWRSASGRYSQAWFEVKNICFIKGAKYQIFGNNKIYFSSKSANKFKRIELLSSFYTIKVPKNSAIYLKLEAVSVPNIDLEQIIRGIPVITVLQDNYISLISTAYFGSSKGHWGFNEINYCFPFRKLKFTTIYYNIGTDEEVFFYKKDEITR